MAPIGDAGSPRPGQKRKPDLQRPSSQDQKRRKPGQPNQPPRPPGQQTPRPASPPAPADGNIVAKGGVYFQVNEFTVSRIVAFLCEKRMNTSLNDIITYIRLKHPAFPMTGESGNRIEDALADAVEQGLLVRHGRFYLLGGDDERVPLDRKTGHEGHVTDLFGPGYRKKRKKRKNDGRGSDDEDLPPRPANPASFGINPSHRRSITQDYCHLSTRIRSFRKEDPAHSRLGKRSRSRSECVALNRTERRGSEGGFTESEDSSSDRSIRRHHGRRRDDDEYVDEENE